MLLAGSELTKEDRESQLYDEFERFKMLPGENINEYYVCFHKLVNDMRNIRMTMPNIQLNSKFVNNMSPEWDRMFKGDRIRIKGILLGEMVQQEIGVHRIELGMPMQVKGNQSSVIIVMELDFCKEFMYSAKMLMMIPVCSVYISSMATVLVELANPQAGLSNASILSEVHILENAIDYNVTNQDEHEIHNKYNRQIVMDSKLRCPYGVCVSPVNDAIVPHNPIAIELKIYKEQVSGRYPIDVEQFPLATEESWKCISTLYSNALKENARNPFVKLYRSSLVFGTRNDHFGTIMGYGDYVISDSVISRVYYVEGLRYNLFSVGQFCDSDLEVAFRKHTCFIRDLDEVDLIKGSCGTNLYTISVEDMMRSSPICLLSKASKNKSWLWHRRLNHLNFGTLNDLACKDLVRGLPRLKFENDHLYLACQLGKSRKATHKPKTINTITEVLHTLHMDLWLVPNSAPAISYVPPTNKDLELLFQPMFDEYFETPTSDHQMPHVLAVPPPVIPTDPSVSISFDHDAPSGSHSPSSSTYQSSSIFELIRHQKLDIMADVNAPVEQAPAVAPPTRIDEQILPHIRWVPIGKSNCYLDAKKSQKQANLQDCGGHSEAYQLLQSVYRLFDNTSYLYSAITPVNNNKAFSSPRTQDTLINFVNDLGKTSGFERLRAPVLQILWGIINRAHIDYAKRMWEEFTQSIHTFTEDKKNLAHHTQGKKKATLIHKFIQRPESPLHLPTEEPILGYLKFSAKGTKGQASNEYLAGEEVSDPNSPAPKPAKSTKPKVTKQAKPVAPKVATKKPQPPPTKPKEKKQKQAKETTESTPPAKRAKAGKVAKKRTLKRSQQLVDEFVDKGIPLTEPGFGDLEADTQRAIEESLKDAHGAPRGPLPPVVFRETDTVKFQPLPEVERKGKEKVGTEQAAQVLLNLQTPKKKSPAEQYIFQIAEQYIFQRHISAPTEPSESDEEVPPVVKSGALDEGQAGPNPGIQDEGQAGPNPGNDTMSQPLSTPGVHAGPNLEHTDAEATDATSQPQPGQMDEEFTATAYPNIQENLKLTVDDPVIPEEPASSTRTLSSLQHLAKDFSFGFQFFNDKPPEANNEKATADTEAESMVSVTIHQDTSVIPPMTSPVIDLVSVPDSPTVHRPLPTTTAATATTTTTIITTIPPPPQPQQVSSDSILLNHLGELEQHIADLVDANQALEERLDKHGSRLYRLENQDIPNQVSKAVDEIVTDAVDWAMHAPLRERFRDLPEADMKEILHNRMWESKSYQTHEDHMTLYEALEKSMARDNRDQLLSDLAEARKKKKKRQGSPKTPSGSPPHPPPPPPPPAGPSGTSGASGASGSSQSPPPPPPPSNTQGGQSTAHVYIYYEAHLLGLWLYYKQFLVIASIKEIQRSSVQCPLKSRSGKSVDRGHRMQTRRSWVCTNAGQVPGEAGHELNLFDELQTKGQNGLRMLKLGLPCQVGLVRYLKAAVLSDVGKSKWYRLNGGLKKNGSMTSQRCDGSNLSGVSNYLRIYNDRHTLSEEIVLRPRTNKRNPGIGYSFWTKKDVDRSKEFMFAIQKRLKTRRIFWNLESFVGGRIREGDYRLLKRTEDW
ncbi:retrovirus-related pol polyprotein from transposon TNT 1-94 [Tanacetum coccineum]